MSDIVFNPDEFSSVINELVPTYHKQILMDALSSDSLNASDFDNIGLSLTGEKRESSFIVETSVKGATEDSMWQAIKSEIFSLLCTNSKTYATERSEGALTIKNFITIVTTSIAATYHIALGVITGAVTLALLSVLKIGKNAWCKINSQQS